MNDLRPYFVVFTLGKSAFLSPLKLYGEILIFIRGSIYSGESLFTILNTSHAIILSILTWSGSVVAWLSSLSKGRAIKERVPCY